MGGPPGPAMPQMGGQPRMMGMNMPRPQQGIMPSPQPQMNPAKQAMIQQLRGGRS